MFTNVLIQYESQTGMFDSETTGNTEVYIPSYPHKFLFGIIPFPKLRLWDTLGQISCYVKDVFHRYITSRDDLVSESICISVKVFAVQTPTGALVF